MKRLYTFLMLIFLTLPLSGCGGGNVELSGSTKRLEILLNDTEFLCLDIPVELTVMKRDNIHYWEYTNDVGIYRMTSTNTSAKLDEETGLYISDSAVIRNFDDCCVVVNCKGNLRDYFMEALSTATISTKDTNTYKEFGLEYLPKYESKAESMELVDDLYMPTGCEEVLYEIYVSRLYTEGDKWLQSTIVDAKFEDLKDNLVTMALMNSSPDKVQGWYESDDMFYCYSDGVIVGAKKLAFNSWYVYQGSAGMEDYILTGINKIHGESIAK